MTTKRRSFGAALAYIVARRGSRFAIVEFRSCGGTSMRFLNLIMGLALAHGCLWPADQAQAFGSDFTEQSAKTTASRIHFNPRAIFSDPRGRPLSNAELSLSVREVLISDESALQPVIAALALATTEEKTAIGTGLGQAMLAVVSTDSSYATDILYALATRTDRIAIAAFVAVAGKLVRGPAFKDANAESAGAGDRSIEPGDNAVSSSFGVAATTTAIGHGNTINPALPSSQADTKSTGPEAALTQIHPVAVIRPVETVKPNELAGPAEAIKPTEIREPADVAKAVETAQPVESVKLAAHSTEAAISAEPSRPTEITKPVETASTAEAIKPMEASRPLEVVKPLEMARPVEADLPSAAAKANAEETRWIVSETTSPVDYSPLVSATIRPRQQVNSGLSGLTISCRAKRIELSLRLMGDLDVPRWGELRIDSQIGDQRSVKQRWRWDEEQGTILFYEGDPIALLQSLPDGARLRLGVGDSKGARHMATYHLFGLDTVRKKVASACPLPSSSAQASSEK
jgi:hypothetical protein